MATALITMTLVQSVELDIDELVERFGKQARTKNFLRDYAVGNRGDDTVVVDSQIVVFKSK